MTLIVTSIYIKATPQQVWDNIIAFKTYPQWNPYFKRIDGEAMPQSEIRVLAQTPMDEPIEYGATITDLEDFRRISWKSQLYMNGVFEREYTAEIKEEGDGRVSFLQSQKYSGLLLPIYSKQIFADAKKGFILSNVALKEMIERGRSLNFRLKKHGDTTDRPRGQALKA